MNWNRSIDIRENSILELSPKLLDTLLKDQTMSTKEAPCNIFWATSDYEGLGEGFEYKSPIMPGLVTGKHGHVIMPRVSKDRDTQRDRSRGKAEVFTPSWVCNAQNNLIDNEWFGREGTFNHENADRTWTTNPGRIAFPSGKTWQDYVVDTRLEITCGEAPYLASRYDAATGEPIPLADRIGLLDRKLRIVGENTDSRGEWMAGAKKAFQSVYGYEWQGDSLLIARENLLATFLDYHWEKFGEDPSTESIEEIAEIISWNIWQMDGLKCVVPDSCGFREGFFGREPENCKACENGTLDGHNGTYCKIQDWGTTPPMEIKFIDIMKNERNRDV